MTIIIFILILLVLVSIHELGHFLAAKISGVKVEEFAFGLSLGLPSIFSFKKGDTKYIFNLLPIGGYVKIYGENGEGYKKNDKTNFQNRNSWIKIFILSSGVIMNLLLAFILIFFSTYNNTAFQVDNNSKEYNELLNKGKIGEEYFTISSVRKNSPADLAGIKRGDIVKKIFLNKENVSGKIITRREINLENKSPEDLKLRIAEAINLEEDVKSLTIEYKQKNKEIKSSTLAGTYEISSSTSKVKTLGISIIKLANVDFSFYESLKISIQKTNYIIKGTFLGFGSLIKGLILGKNVGENISGPVGIFNLVKEANDIGFSYLLYFTAILSVSLAVFNILPFPALDGGRIFFILIENIFRIKIKEKWQSLINGIGFFILILLMIFISVKDIIKIFK